MIMTSFLKNRKSVREFKKKKVDTKTIEKIKTYLNSLNELGLKEGTKFSLYENGDNLYKSLKGLGGYSGVMIESPHYISLAFLENNTSSIISGAYSMEKLITELNKLGLDTCWISLNDVKKDDKDKALGEDKGEVNYLLALGYSRPKNPFINETFSERIGVEELVFNENIGEFANLEELEARGLGDLFYYVRFAPSARNEQPWRFLLKDNKAILLLKDMGEENLSLIDAGIIMYYFESLASSIGINSNWNLIDENMANKDPNYKYIAEIKL